MSVVETGDVNNPINVKGANNDPTVEVGSPNATAAQQQAAANNNQQQSGNAGNAFVGTNQDVSNIVAREVKKAVSGIYTKLGVEDGNIEVAKELIAKAKAGPPAGATSKPAEGTKPDDKEAEAMQEITLLRAELAVKEANVDDKFKSWVIDTLLKTEGGASKENVEAFKKANPQYFDTGKVVAVSSSPSLSGGAPVVASPNQKMNEFIRGRGERSLD